MWVLEVQVAVQPDWSGPFESYRITHATASIGRPAKGSTVPSVDIVIAGDSAVSKHHASLIQEGGELSIKELSRFGTWVNGVKLAPDSEAALKEGDRIQMAAKVHARVRKEYLRLALSSGLQGRQDLAKLAESVGLTLQSFGSAKAGSLDAGVSFCLAEEGSLVCSSLARALLAGVSLVKPSWLQELASRPVWTKLPPCEPHRPTFIHTLKSGQDAAQDDANLLEPTLLLEDCQRAVQQDGLADLLRGLGVTLVHGYQDRDLEICLEAVGASVLSNQAAEASAGPAIAVSEAEKFVFEAGGKTLAHLTVPELLACILKGDSSQIQQRILNVNVLTDAEAMMTSVTAEAEGGLEGGRGAEGGRDGGGAAGVHDDGGAAWEDGLLNSDVGEEGEDAWGGPDRLQPGPAALPWEVEQDSPREALLDPAPGAKGTRGRKPFGQLPANTGNNNNNVGRQRREDDDGLFGPAPVLKQNAALALQQRPVSRFTPTARAQQDEAAPAAAAAADAPAGASPGSAKGRRGGGARAAKAAPKPAAHVDVPVGGSDAETAPEHPQETVGPGHAVVYLPLVVQPPAAAARHEAAGGAAEVPNFKKFQKQGASTAPSTSRRGPAAAQPAALVPLMVMDGSIVAEAKLRQEHQRQNQQPDEEFRSDLPQPAAQKKRRKK